MAANLVDVSTPDGRYLRALGGFVEPVIVSVTQPRADALAVSVSGVGDTKRVLMIVRRMLGTERDVSDFHRGARAIPWLAPCFSRSVCMPRAPSCAG